MLLDMFVSASFSDTHTLLQLRECGVASKFTDTTDRHMWTNVLLKSAVVR